MVTCGFLQVSIRRAPLDQAPVEPDHSTPEESLHETGETDTEFHDQAIDETISPTSKSLKYAYTTQK